ncbi:uncharacterized protein LDX57_004812 [Aspergillus melleus]|uniref:uncharacterized protein n=1 Tax=Aspergillus melleus TaxID=138277 RepID=UPI001E8DC652|nr:uncharacterized protein LDX57_004812 [Aspergillus melleus]KAH8427095.1 hypothetical protein LDX57_004812 [Aspergillus melleus]
MSHPYAYWPSAPGIPQFEPVPEDAAINNHNQLEPQAHLMSSFSLNHAIATSSIDEGPIPSQGHGTQPSRTPADLAAYVQLPELAFPTSLPNNVNFHQSFMLPVPMSNGQAVYHPTHTTNGCHDQRPNINE